MMFKMLWTSLKRATVGEKLEDIGRATGEWGATAHVDIRRGSNGGTYVTLSITSNISVELNSRTTTYAYLNDAAVEKLAADLAQAVKQRQALG